ncbi:MAG: hypothetical protein K2W95_32120 [Candidatus Obscuribacterales bacterium]|nr:hypothetical protein [Candidatus Obscuribacterales bacterium]
MSNFAKANTAFGLNLLRTAHSNAAGKPVQVSPFSVRRALSMTALGARGATLDSFRDTFQLARGTDLVAVHKHNQEVLAALLASERHAEAKTDIAVANALWLRKNDGGYGILPAFIAANAQYYGAVANDNLPFDQTTLDAINAWCKENTKGKIERILEELPGGAHAVLTDALYMKTPAKQRFYKRNDTQGKFKLADGSEKDVTFMTNPHGEFNYFNGDGVEVLQFPFGESGNFNYYLVLPKADRTLDETVAALTVENWLGWKGAMVEGEGSLRLAPNEQEYGEELKKALCALGLANAFSDAADFSAMCTGGLKIGAVNHKTFTKFTRKGFEGAAVTAVGMIECVWIPTDPKPRFDITVDRPYAWFVEGGDEILFASTTVDPKEPAGFDAETDDDDTFA